MDVEPVAVEELEAELADVHGPDGGHADLFLDLANGGFLRRLARLDATAWSVDLARAEASLLADEQHLAVAHDEEECRPVDWSPGRPIDGRRLLQLPSPTTP